MDCNYTFVTKRNFFCCHINSKSVYTINILFDIRSIKYFSVYKTVLIKVWLPYGMVYAENFLGADCIYNFSIELEPICTSFQSKLNGKLCIQLNSVQCQQIQCQIPFHINIILLMREKVRGWLIVYATPSNL